MRSPDALNLEVVGVCGVEGGHKAAHRNVLHLSDHQWVREEHRTLVHVQHRHVYCGCRAGPIAHIWHQGVLILYPDEQRVERRRLIVQRLEGREERERARRWKGRDEKEKEEKSGEVGRGRRESKRRGKGKRKRGT